MQFDASDLDTFRGILTKLSRELSLSSTTAINLVWADRQKRNRADLDEFHLTRASLDRFKSGGRIKSISGLRELWRVLESHQDYSHFFPQPQDAPAALTSDAPLATTLIRFFSENIQQCSYDLAALGDMIVGHYVMYRPDWRPRIPTGLARASLVKIAAANPGFSISETQDFPATKTERAYWQHDTGAMASFGRFIYFLMKEEKAPGTAVKFGLVNALFPNSGNSLVDWFRGIVFTSSNLNIYPLAKFFCKRIDDEPTVQFKLMKTEDIPDDDAKVYLLDPLNLPM